MWERDYYFGFSPACLSRLGHTKSLDAKVAWVSASAAGEPVALYPAAVSSVGFSPARLSSLGHAKSRDAKVAGVSASAAVVGCLVVIRRTCCTLQV